MKITLLLLFLVTGCRTGGTPEVDALLLKIGNLEERVTLIEASLLDLTTDVGLLQATPRDDGFVLPPKGK